MATPALHISEERKEKNTMEMIDLLSTLKIFKGKPKEQILYKYLHESQKMASELREIVEDHSTTTPEDKDRLIDSLIRILATTKIELEYLTEEVATLT